MGKIFIVANGDACLFNIRRELIEKLAVDNEIFIVCPTGEYRDFFEGCGYNYLNIDIDRRGMNPVKDIKVYRQCRKLLKEFKPDLVLTYTIKANIYCGYACKKEKIPYCVNITGLGSAFYNGALIKKIVVTLYKLSIRNAKRVFFENNGNCQVFNDNKIVKKDKCVVLNGAGVNIDKYSYQPMIQYETTKFCFVGRIMKEKGIEELFAAIKKVKANGYNATFDFYGDFEENYISQIETMVQNNLISYYGLVKDLDNRYKNYHCLILPSYHEGMANVLLEAGSTGRALIASNVYGCKESIIDGVNGYLVNKADSNDLYEKIVRFVGLTSEEKARMGQASRKIMEEKFDRVKVIDKTIEEIMS